MSSTELVKTRPAGLSGGIPYNGGMGSAFGASKPAGTSARAATSVISQAERAPGHQKDAHGGIRSPTKSDFSIGCKLRELRRARMITQKELAAMVGVTGAQLHRYEMGTTRVAASRLISIAEALGVNADILMGAATGPEPCSVSLALAGGDDDIIELINIFCGIKEQKNRSAIIAVARMLGAKGAPAREASDQE